MTLLLGLLACQGPSDLRGPRDAPTDPGPPDIGFPEGAAEERRWDCSGIPGPDPAPLGGRIALTFDDGPHPVNTPRVLQILRDYSIPATFFVLGESLSDPDTWPIVEEMVSDPLFDVGNHSWDHADLATLSLSDVEDEIDDTTALIETFGVTPRFFRFPYGDSTCETHDLVTDRGLAVTGWHVDTVDWCYSSDGTCSSDYYFRIPEEYQDDMLGFTLEQSVRFDGGVVLLHDIHDATADALEDVIFTLLSAGFTFTSLDDTDAFPNLNSGVVVDRPYLGEACVDSDDHCFETEYLSYCEGGICTMPCERSCPERDGGAATFCMAVETGAGQCVAESEGLNDFCAALPGTSEVVAEAYDGSGTAEVCAPAAFL
ncbi:MAG: polysaccharide deacetylase family protein [Deltaproteobacteria bacterium]|nr:polysaccharide deacetylase family protein [Deltaproteobacteria bacterium]